MNVTAKSQAGETAVPEITSNTAMNKYGAHPIINAQTITMLCLMSSNSNFSISAVSLLIALPPFLDFEGTDSTSTLFELSTLGATPPSFVFPSVHSFGCDANTTEEARSFVNVNTSITFPIMAMYAYAMKTTVMLATPRDVIIRTKLLGSCRLHFGPQYALLGRIV
ncbi:hypothetical protein BJ741DRAFT_586596 [Chytriomyces cf. hyalinus JEL632]|nr:hypothetical protein BJ741DRAFT_586596 [Chytriomyces cf. hyalinus JEL632]